MRYQAVIAAFALMLTAFIVPVAGAHADTLPQHLAKMPVLETFNGGKVSLDHFDSRWEATTDIHYRRRETNKGVDDFGGWRAGVQHDEYAGALYKPISFPGVGGVGGTETTVAAEVTLATPPAGAYCYFELDLGERAGGLGKLAGRFKLYAPPGERAHTLYQVELGYYTPDLSYHYLAAALVADDEAKGNRFALVAEGETLSFWESNGGESEFTELLTAKDPGLVGGSEGHAGIGARGSGLRLKDFSAEQFAL